MGSTSASDSAENRGSKGVGRRDLIKRSAALGLISVPTVGFLSACARSGGGGDEDKPNGSGAPAEAKPAQKAKPYTIKPGDTLTAISGTTGVPIGILVETNKIQNPDLIYAWASLLIPPV